MTRSVHPLPAALLAEIAERVGPEWYEWYALTPAERWNESARLWQTYAALGGSLDPVADPERINDLRDARSPLPADGRSGMRTLRRL